MCLGIYNGEQMYKQKSYNIYVTLKFIIMRPAIMLFQFARLKLNQG